ncbi:MAG: hypothetical protein ACI4QN_06860 [Candidatus Coproplasma sp.]
MFDVLTETFLYEYFLYDCMLGELYDRKSLFRILGDIFCLPKNEISDLFSLTESEAVREIKTEDGFKRYKRIKQYNHLVGSEQIYTEKEDTLIAIKGDAIKAVCQYSINSDGESTQTSVVKTLMNGVENGNILALKTVGILKCEGIFVKKDLNGGIKCLRKAMMWGDIPATLSMLKYSDMDKVRIMQTLNSSVKDTLYEFLPEIIAERYGVSAEMGYNEEMLLIRKAVGANKLNKDTYDSMYARLIFSDVISFKDKEKILFSENKEMVSEACDLPLHLNYGEVPIDATALKNIPLYRESEIRGIFGGLYGSDLRASDSFRPMCLCSDSEYVLETYASAVSKALQSTHIEKIEVAELREFDFEPTKNNVFVRCLNERKNNVYLLVFRGNISDAAIELTKTVLRSEKRRNFRLHHPAVTLDLSSVLPICVCDKENAKKLKNLVEIVELAPVQTAEKAYVINYILEDKRRLYNLGKVLISGDVMEKLYALPVENTEKILDKTIRENRKTGQTLKLTLDAVKPYLNKKTGYNNAYGFGGVIDENK